MISANNYIQLPKITDYCCIETVVTKIKQLNEECSLQSKLSQVALIALAEIAAIFDFFIESAVFCNEVLYDLFHFSLLTSENFKKYFSKTLTISYFFVGLIPYIIASNLDLKKLDSCLEGEPVISSTPESTVLDFYQSELTKKEKELQMRIDTIAIIKEAIAKYDDYLSVDLSYFEKFTCLDGDFDELTKKIEQLIFWTNTCNHDYLLQSPLTSDESLICEELHKFYKSLLAIHQLFGKFYSIEALFTVNSLIGDEFLKLEKIINFDRLEPSVHKKIFWTFRKIYLLQQHLEKGTRESEDTAELLNNFIFHIYQLFDSNLVIHHQNLELLIKKPICIQKEHIIDHFEMNDEDIHTFIEKFLIFLEGLTESTCTNANLANYCMQKSLRNCLEKIGREPK